MGVIVGYLKRSMSGPTLLASLLAVIVGLVALVAGVVGIAADWKQLHPDAPTLDQKLTPVPEPKVASDVVLMSQPKPGASMATGAAAPAVQPHAQAPAQSEVQAKSDSAPTSAPSENSPAKLELPNEAKE